MVTDIVKAFQKDIAKRQEAKKSSSSSKSKNMYIKGQKITAIQTKRDGSKIYYSGNTIVRETNPQGKSIQRISVTTPGSGTPSSGMKTPQKTPQQIIQQKTKELVIRQEQQKAKLKALLEGRTAKQQQARLANKRFIKKVEDSIKKQDFNHSERNRSLLMSQSSLSGKTATEITQGVVLKQTLESIRKSPFNIDVIRALTAAVDVSRVDPSKYRYGRVKIGDVYVEPNSLKELNFYNYLKKVEQRNQKIAKLAKEIEDRSLIGQEKKGLTKFLKDKKTLRGFVDGLTKLGVGVLISPLSISMAFDNAIARFKGSMSRKSINLNLKKNLRYIPQVIALKIPKRVTDKIADKITGVIPEKITSPERVSQELKATRPQKIKTTIKEIGRSFDPRKPENWANIISIIAGIVLSGVQIRSSLSKVKSNYIPSTRGINTIENGVNKILKNIPEFKKQYRKIIKTGTRREASFAKRQLSRVLRLEDVAKSLKSKMVVYRNAANKGVILSVNDMNPVVKTANLLNSMGRTKYLYHAGTTAIKDSFKKGSFDVISPGAVSKVVARVSKKSFQPRRMLSTPRKIDKELILFVRRTKGIVGGAKAQNVFVRFLRKRKTLDYDVFYKDPKSKVLLALRELRKKFPNDKLELVVLKIPNSKLRVYRIKFNGKDLADFDPIPKDLGVPVRVGKDLVASPEFLAKRKLSTQGDVQKFGRVSKDEGDLLRLLDRRTSKDFIDKISKPKNVFKVLPQPSGMGKSRLAFRETQLFLDVEVPIGYAIKSLVKPRFKGVPELQRFVNTVAGRKVLLPKLFRQKIFKRGAKGVIMRLPVDINDFVKMPRSLLSRVKKASRGQLNRSQSVKLRKDLRDFIENPKNLQKISIGSRTGSLTKGEREFVLSEMSSLYKPLGKTKFTIDPATKLFSEVIDVTLKATKPTSKAGRILSRIKNKLKVFTPEQLKFRFSKGDLTRLRRYKRLLRLEGKVSDQNYRDLLYFLDSMMSDKKGSRTFTHKFSLKNVRSSRKNFVKPRGIGKLAKRVAPGIAKRTALRSVSRVKPRVVPRVGVRSKSRVKPRVVPRTRPRVVPRTRPRVVPRTRPRVVPRTRPRMVPRRVARTIRLPPRLPKRITVILRKKKRVSKSDKKELLEFVKKSKAVYRPSLAAYIYGITSYSVPKSVNPFIIRPIIIEMRKQKILK